MIISRSIHGAASGAAIPLLGIYLDKTLIQKDTSTPMFTAALFTIAETGKQPKRPLTGEWIKMWYTHTHTHTHTHTRVEYYSAIKKNGGVKI